jgi:hypothetical protein
VHEPPGWIGAIVDISIGIGPTIGGIVLATQEGAPHALGWAMLGVGAAFDVGFLYALIAPSYETRRWPR